MADDAGAERLACETEIALSRPDFRPLLSALAMPALVVGGDRDPINPPVVQAEMAATLPHAALAMIADSGHFTPLEQPAALAPHVADWLARVDQAHHRHQEERQ
jgi:pimeloyl-ACP methyl ester carboxylesterase